MGNTDLVPMTPDVSPLPEGGTLQLEKVPVAGTFEIILPSSAWTETPITHLCTLDERSYSWDFQAFEWRADDDGRTLSDSCPNEYATTAEPDFFCFLTTWTANGVFAEDETKMTIQHQYFQECQAGDECTLTTSPGCLLEWSTEYVFLAEE